MCLQDPGFPAPGPGAVLEASLSQLGNDPSLGDLLAIGRLGTRWCNSHDDGVTQSEEEEEEEEEEDSS